MNALLNNYQKYINYIAAIFCVIVWGSTFANTRSLLHDFSSLEIMLIRFGLAWLALFLLAFVKDRKSIGWSGRNEWLFAAIGFSDVFAYQFLENCAIYYTNASNVVLNLKENIERFSRPMNLMNLSFLGLLSSAVTFVLWTRACAGLGVAKTSICLYLEPVFAVMFSVIFLGESLSLMSTIGGITIFIGLYLANQRCSCKNKNTK